MIRVAMLVAPLMAAPTMVAEAPIQERPLVRELLRGPVTAQGRPAQKEGGGEMVVRSYDIPPGLRVQLGHRSATRYAYVLTGRLRITGPGNSRPREFGPGDIINSICENHIFGESLGQETLRLLVIDQEDAESRNAELVSTAPR